MLAPLDDPHALAELLFKNSPYAYQDKIFNALFIKRARKITIRATTRAGKSYALAEAAITAATFWDNCRVGVLAPTHIKTRIIGDYVADLLASNSIFDDIVMLEVENLSKLERLRKEVSKKRITFKNGSSITFQTIDLGSKGMALMGHAFDVIIVDETGEIDAESYAKIYRMLVENEKTTLIEIGNPWTLGHFYEHHHSDDWEKIHISWQDCVKAGRMTMAAVEDQRKNLTELEFKVLFDADFPDEIEHAIFSKQAMDNMARPKTLERYDEIVIGIDPAAGGRDLTVITPYGVKVPDFYQLPGLALDERDAMAIVGHAQEFIEANFKTYRSIQGKDRVKIGVDTVNNRGVHDRLKERGYIVQEFIAGKKARYSKRFYNHKTETAFRVAELAKEGHIWNMPPASKYALQFRQWTFEVRSDRQLKLVDPEEKSPDFADSAIMALSCQIYHEDAYAVGIEGGVRPVYARGIERPHRRLF